MTPHPLGFLNQLERDWEATQTCAPGRDRRLDGLYDDALIHHCVRAGMSFADARRSIAEARRHTEAQHHRP
ncbi:MULTISPECIES: hypothetical protein [unclassified Streptomyces]|uniref:hypothetical protein n=1 Tax=unclassified Streptomyces TaxID=2593676 RepID=UPI00081E171C|nr:MULTISPECIES: hypothetical protein [unclassified Streptomyces]MYR29164.1 hypothetical protein [Streptomyces sp. SID4945]SCF44380.1 hypothetical protein GA0115257_11701 [Streptomyces sp. LcepLS]